MTLYWVTRILVLSQLLAGVLSTCDCSFTDPQIINPLLSPQAFILGAYDEFGNPCVPTVNTCILRIQSGDETWGLTGFTLSTLTNPSEGSVVVTFRNQDSSAIGAYTSGPDPQDLTSQQYGLSNSPMATVKIDYNGVDPNDQTIKVVGSIMRTNKLNTATVRPSTAKPTPVPTYAGPIPLNGGNPQLISDDIFFAVDIGKGSGDSAAFTEMMGVVNSIVGLLAVTEDATSTTQTRITVGSLSPVAGYSVFGNTWQTSQDDVKNILGFQKIGRAPSVYQTALNTVFAPKGAFGLKNTDDPTQNSRQTTTRLYIIVTTADPADFDSTNFTNSGYGNVDAHPIVLAYKYSGTQLASLTTNGWSFFNMVDNSNNNTGAFVSKYLLNGDATCPLSVDPATAATLANDGTPQINMASTTDDHAHIHLKSANYDGPKTDSTPTMAPWTRNDGTKSRYCNFQNSNYYYSAKAGNGIKFTIYYELEPEKDYLRFFDATWNELAAFTGYDVSGTNFIFNGGDVRVQFVTDEKNVYGGFEIVAENVLLPPTVMPIV